MITLVLANGMTSLLALTQCHILVLNVLIGLGEARLLVGLGRAEWKRAWWLMVLANYASMIAGVVVLYPLAGWLEESWTEEPMFYRVGRMLLVLIAVAFVLTVVVEAPFVLLSLRTSGSTRRRKLALCFGVQAASYAVLCILYAGASPISLLTETTRVRDVSALAGGSRGWVYYCREDLGEVWRVRLDGTQAQEWAKADKAMHPWAQLWAEPADGGVRLMRWHLNDKPEPIGTVVAGRCGEVEDDQYPRQGPGVAVNRASDFREPDKRPDTYFADPYGKLTHYLGDGKSGISTLGYIALTTPFMQWRAVYPSILPSNAVVFEIEKQVVIMDRTKRIGVLAMGTSPVVVLDPSPGETQDEAKSDPGN